MEQAFKALDYLKQQTCSALFSPFVPRIRAFDKENLINVESDNFCIPETRLVLKNELPFETGSVFQKKILNLANWDSKIETDFLKNKRSSGHFLAETIHELMHSVYIKLIYTKYGYGGKCPYTNSLYPCSNSNKSGLDVMYELQNKNFSKEENLTINYVLGNYATKPRNQYHEVFAETFTKLICDSLSDDAMPKANPLDGLKRLPPEFLKILYKVLNI